MSIAEYEMKIQAQRGVIIEHEKRYLDTKKMFVRAMAFGKGFDNHEKCRTWALHKVRHANPLMG